MALAKTFQTTTHSTQETEKLGAAIGGQLKGGEVIELAGDIGAGKTTFVRGLARGIDSTDAVASPTFVLNRVYRGKQGVLLHHFDFYRLEEPGVMRAALLDVLSEPKAAVVIEWSDVLAHVLPKDRLTVSFEVPAEAEREITLAASDNTHARLLEGVA